MFPDILSGTDKGIFFMDKKGNQEDDIETHARRYQIIKPEYISKYIEEDEIEYSRKSTDDDKFKKFRSSALRVFSRYMISFLMASN